MMVKVVGGKAAVPALAVVVFPEGARRRVLFAQRALISPNRNVSRHQMP